MNKVILKKHFRDRLAERFGYTVSDVMSVDRESVFVWTKKNLDKCSNMMIKRKLVSRTDCSFMVENIKLNVVICGNKSNGYTFINTVIPRINLPETLTKL
jgi:hypothetical protein